MRMFNILYALLFIALYFKDGNAIRFLVTHESYHASNVYIVGEHPQATHYCLRGSDIYNILQPLLDSVSSATIQSTVMIAKGQYYLSANIQVGSNTHLTGYGMDKSILKLSSYASKFNKAGFVRSVLTSNVMISNLTLDGNKYNQYAGNMDADVEVEYSDDITYGRYGIFTEGSVNVTFDSVLVTNFQGYGFDPHGQKKTMIFGNQLTIKHCMSTYNDWDGYTLDQTLHIHVYNCTSRNNGRHGFNVVTGSRFVTIENVTSVNDGYYYSVNSTGCGITIQNNQGYGTHSAIFRNNIIITPKKGGICTRDVYNITMFNNIITAQTCMRIEGTNNTYINSTTCINASPTRRIMVDARSKNVVVQNTMNKVDHNIPLTGEVKEITIGFSEFATYKVVALSDVRDLFQNALNEIKYNGGGTLYIEPGVYTFSGFIEMGGNTRVVGAGMNATILRLENNAAPWWVPNTRIRRSGFLRAMYVSNLQISNLTVDGNRANQKNDTYSVYGRYGLYTEACNNVYVDSVAIINFQGYGFDPHGTKSLLLWGVNLTIANSYAGNNGYDGYTIDQSRNVILRNNTARYNARHGFNIVTGTTNLTMTLNTAADNGHWFSSRGCGIMIQNNNYYGTSRVSVFNSTITNSSDAGICMTDVTQMRALYNVIDKTAVNTCIRLRNVTTALISYNTCILATRGLNIQTSTNVTTEFNTIVR